MDFRSSWGFFRSCLLIFMLYATVLMLYFGIRSLSISDTLNFWGSYDGMYAPSNGIEYVQKDIPGWEKGKSRDMSDYLYPDAVSTVSVGTKICPKSMKGLKMVILVHSAPVNVAARLAIRETWAGADPTRVRVGFVLGLSSALNQSQRRHIQKESLVFNDIILEDFIDSYYNLTLKSGFMLKWFLTQCSAPFLMKTDDDILVYMDNVNKIWSRDLSPNLLGGFPIVGNTPRKNVHDKWYTPKYMYSKRFYPVFLSGTSYVMSRTVATALYWAVLRTPFFHLEDVYITGICAKRAGVLPQKVAGFSHGYNTNPCLKHLITSHWVTPERMKNLWRDRLACK